AEPGIPAAARRRLSGAGGRAAQVQHHLPDLRQRAPRDDELRQQPPRPAGVRHRRPPRPRALGGGGRAAGGGARVPAAVHPPRRRPSVHGHALGHLGPRGRAGAVGRAL
ncbi:MAG: hypothetical protein AVDCRST_MAG11-1614, partial [uncultured Gemmatimonadaceae bacterium]